MLLGELRHRMKNLLGITQSMAWQTRTEGRTAAEFREDFMGRFNALIEAEDLAFSDHNGAGLTALFERILAPFRNDRASIEIEHGPAVELPSRALVSLSLIFHELATNAVKYGALSVPGGQVRVRWQVVGHELRFTWIERGGPAVTPPTQTGFGSNLIRSATSYNLGGRAEQHFAPEGLTAEIVMPAPSI
ncbi:sensor histidine kinase [Rhodopseudomonas palustris]|uniref:sensor histidine kinase n=1 Tax=Rhodopseudomonas palustris TaxID=1076 RepID=UPI001F3BA506|nr:sensor histidine kinase [Rhodopseudomonas palustris]